MFEKEGKIVFKESLKNQNYLLVGGGAGFGQAVHESLGTQGGNVDVTRTTEGRNNFQLELGSDEQDNQITAIIEQIKQRGSKLNGVIFGMASKKASLADTLMKFNLDQLRSGMSNEDLAQVEALIVNAELALKQSIDGEEDVELNKQRLKVVQTMQKKKAKFDEYFETLSDELQNDIFIKEFFELYSSFQVITANKELADVMADPVLEMSEQFLQEELVDSHTKLIYMSYRSKYPNYFPEGVKAEGEDHVRSLREDGFEEAYSYRGQELLTEATKPIQMISVGIVAEFKKNVLETDWKDSDFWSPLVEYLTDFPEFEKSLELLDDVFEHIEKNDLMSLTGHEFNNVLSFFLRKKGLARGLFLFFAQEISKALKEVAGYEIGQVMEGNMEAMEKLQIVKEDQTILQGGKLLPAKQRYADKLSEKVSKNDKFLGADNYNVFRVKGDGVFQVDGLDNEVLENHFHLCPGVAQVNLLEYHFPEISVMRSYSGVQEKFKNLLLPHSQVRVQKRVEGKNVFFEVVDANNPNYVYLEIMPKTVKAVDVEMPEGDAKVLKSKDYLPHGDKFRFPDEVRVKPTDGKPTHIEADFDTSKLIDSAMNLKEGDYVTGTVIAETMAQAVAIPILEYTQKADVIFTASNTRVTNERVSVGDKLVLRGQLANLRSHNAAANIEVLVEKTNKETGEVEYRKVLEGRMSAGF